MNYEFWNTLTPEQQTFYTEVSQGYALGQLFSDHSAGWDAIHERIDNVLDTDPYTLADAIDDYEEGIVVWGEWANNGLRDFRDAIESLARDFLEAIVGGMWAYNTRSDKGVTK
jgi:hypothetical protein